MDFAARHRRDDSNPQLKTQPCDPGLTAKGSERPHATSRIVDRITEKHGMIST